MVAVSVTTGCAYGTASCAECRALAGTAADGSSATRRQHCDNWQHYVFAQTPPNPSGKPPSKSKPMTFGRFWHQPKELETVQNTKCCRWTSNCSQMPTSWAGGLPQLTPERKRSYHMPLQSESCAPEK
eukprot:5067907-Prymnesium_polylepis.1